MSTSSYKTDSSSTVSVKIDSCGAKHILADGGWCEPGLQGTDIGRHPVRAQSRVEPDRSDGSHKSIGKWNGQVSSTTQTARCHVAHAREHLPRDATETTHLVVCRQRCLQRRLL